MKEIEFKVESNLRGALNASNPNSSTLDGHINVTTAGDLLSATMLFSGRKVQFNVSVMGIKVLGLEAESDNTTVSIKGVIDLTDDSPQDLQVLVERNGKSARWAAQLAPNGFTITPDQLNLQDNELAYKLTVLMEALGDLLSSIIKAIAPIINPS